MRIDKKNFFHSLHSRLILLIILIALPSLIGLLYQSFVERKVAIEAATQQALTTVEFTTINQAILIKETQTFLQRLSQFSSVLNPESAECSIFLAEILKLNNRYINLGIPRADGELFCNANPLEKRVNVADRPYIQQALATKGFSIGQYQIDRAASVTSINFAYPVIHPTSNSIIGLAVAVVSLDWWSKHLSQSHLPKNTVAYITDNEQTIIATYPVNNRLLGLNIKNVQQNLPDDGLMLNKPVIQITNTAKPNEQIQRMFVSKPLFKINNQPKAYITVGIPIDEQLAVINSQLLQKSSTLLIFILLMFILAMWGIKISVLNPLKTLLQSTKNLQLGKSIDSITPQGTSELIDLQQQFVLMAKTRLHAEQQLINSQASLTESKNKLSLHIENTPLGCISWDRNLVCTEWNKSAEKIFGYSEQEAIGRHVSELIISPELIDEINSVYALLIKQQGENFHTNENVTKDGRTILCEWYNTPIVEKGDKVTGVCSLVQDITKRKQLEEKLTQASYVFSHALEGIVITDASAIIIDVNNTFVEITGYEREDVLGKNPSILKSDHHSSLFYEKLWQSLIDTGQWHGEVWNKRKNNQIFPEKLSISAVYDETGNVKNYIAVFTDLTEIKAHQRQLEHMAHYDVLTGLPNRTLLADRLMQAITQSKRSAQPLAVAFLDLDGFKSVNDEYGHDIGDELLVALAARISEALRDGDTLSRFGGDEFVVVLTNVENNIDFKPVLERLLKAASKPITVGNNLLKVSASIGATLYPQDNSDAELLIRHADQAMYIAKQQGKNCYHLFDIASEGEVKDLRESRQQISNSLKNQEFVLYYQPKVNIKTGEIIGVEALIRWQHPEQGLLPPIEFLPLVENHTLSITIGEWVINEALSQISTWHKQGLNIPISVNIGAQQLKQQDFTERLAILLAAHPTVAPSNLQLEVLETSGLGNIMNASEIMHNCVALGVSFALDDFGTGYSSLTYLRRLPANLIKIDQTFVRDMLIDPDDLAIVEGVVALAKSFNRAVIAEGVETIAHGTALLKLGCELAQGYGIAKPMPAEQVPEWSATWQPDKDWQ